MSALYSVGDGKIECLEISKSSEDDKQYKAKWKEITDEWDRNRIEAIKEYDKIVNEKYVYKKPKRQGRGRRKGEKYVKSKSLYRLYIMADSKNKLCLGKYSSYAKIAKLLGLNRTTVQNIALKKLKHKYNNIIVERIVNNWNN